MVCPDDLRAFRSRHGLSQAQAAAALGVSVRTWEAWEAGRRSLRDGMLRTLIAYYDTYGPIEPPTRRRAIA